MEILDNLDLGARTTLGVGGAARYFCRVESEDDLVAARGWAAANLKPWLVLGGGSNLIVADSGFRGLVIEDGLRGIRDLGGGLVEAAAGENWDGFVAWTVERGLAGLECLSGIPGTVGATPVQNVGAYGQEVAAVIAGVRGFDTAACGFVELPPEACDFGYRSSRFNRQDRGRYLISTVRFRLKPDGAATLNYAELRRRFPVGAAGIDAVRRSVLEIRRGKGMVIEAGSPYARTAGSFFKNPVVDKRKAAELGERHPAMPQFPAGEGVEGVKLSAAWLIERSGCGRGFRLPDGGAQISPAHALAILADAGARTAEVVRLARHVRGAVQAAFGVGLTVEPEQIGFAPGDLI